MDYHEWHGHSTAGAAMSTLRDEIKGIEQTRDPLTRGLLLAALVTRLFKAAGFDLVVVGGSAVEVYTEGAYMSGDIDLCKRNLRPVPPRTAQDLMAKLGATGGPRSWKVAGIFVDLLGLIENEAVTPYRKIETPYGALEIIPPELILVERVLLAMHPAPNPEARRVARLLMAVCVSGATPVDWDEVERLAALPAFAVADELKNLRQEVQGEV